MNMEYGDFLALTLGTVSFGVTVLCLMYIKYKLKVSTHIKKVLFAKGISTLGTLIIQHIGYYGYASNTLQPQVYCTLLIMTVPARCAMNIFFGMVLAIIRFYMADRTGRNLLVDHSKIETYFNVSILVYFIFWALMYFCEAFLGLHYSIFVANCAASKNNPIIQIVFLLSMMVSILTMLYNDVKLVLFVRNQNRTQPIRMQAWTAQQDVPPVNRPNLNDQLKDTVPIISSTCLSCFMFFFLLGSVIIKRILNYPGIELIVVLFGGIISILHLPVVLAFTVKSQDKKKTRTAMPPSGLQYHDPVDNP